MTSRFFEVSQDILIDASPAVAPDCPTNPASRLARHPTLHHIECPGHPLGLGARFPPRLRMRNGMAGLNRLGTASDRPHPWQAEADTSFIGRIIAERRFVALGTRTHYSGTLVNPANPRPPTTEMRAQIDEDTRICLVEIKSRIEQRARQAT
jgi:hypothetical protein